MNRWMNEKDAQRTSSRAPTPDTTIDSNVNHAKSVGIENCIPAGVDCCRNEDEVASVIS